MTAKFGGSTEEFRYFEKTRGGRIVRERNQELFIFLSSSLSPSSARLRRQ